MELQDVVGSQGDRVKALKNDVKRVGVSRNLLLGAALRLILSIRNKPDALIGGSDALDGVRCPDALEPC